MRASAILLLLCFLSLPCDIWAKDLSFGKQPFTVYWNVPSEKCKDDYGINIDVSQYGILQNSIWQKHEGLDGDKIAIFYTAGQWPHYPKKGSPINGGLPQLGNITFHLEALAAAVDELLPKNFSGIGVLDYEIPNPSWERQMYKYGMKDIYIKKSIELVKASHPKWSEAKLIKEADKQYTEGARLFYKQSIFLVKKMRPQAWWGYYGLPFCSPQTQTKRVCSTKQQGQNNRLEWVYNISDVLMPSVYFKNLNLRENMNHAYTIIQETMRIRDRMNKTHQPILPYTAYQVFPSDTKLYSMAQLVYSLGQAADLGIEGMVVWGGITDQKFCTEFAGFINSTMGPYIKEILNFTQSCRKSLCNSHGRCSLVSEPKISARLGKISEKYANYNVRVNMGKASVRASSIKDNVLNEVNAKYISEDGLMLKDVLNEMTASYIDKHHLDESSLNSLYKCKCDQQWSGDHCQTNNK